MIVTPGTIIKQIETNEEESSKHWMLWIVKKAREKNSKNNHYQFWHQDNQPVQLETTDFTLSELDYIHNNPVKAGIVEHAADYTLSSAKDYCGSRGLLPIEHLTAAYTLRK